MNGTQYMVIDFTPDGSAEAMHRENILDLGFLGPQDIQRASEIKFDSATQTWGIWPSKSQQELDTEVSENGYHGAEGFLPPPKYGTGFTTYEGARLIEVAWFERCRLHGWLPMSHEGKICLQAIVMAQVVSAGY